MSIKFTPGGNLPYNSLYAVSASISDFNLGIITSNSASYTENTGFSITPAPRGISGRDIIFDSTGKELIELQPAPTSTPTATPTPEPTPTPDIFITNDGAGAFLIDGVSNDTITLVRGQTYIFELDAPGHPFWIQSVPAPYNVQEVYNDGIEGNGTAVGTITWTVSQSTPSTLYYVCQFHSVMSGTILIIDEEESVTPTPTPTPTP